MLDDGVCRALAQNCDRLELRRGECQWHRVALGTKGCGVTQKRPRDEVVVLDDDGEARLM
jgi:hypothetical protein